jgi:hypothetical protein
MLFRHRIETTNKQDYLVIVGFDTPSAGASGYSTNELVSI